MTRSAWLTIWTEPRATIRTIIETNCSAGFYPLSWLYGFAMLFSIAQNLSLGNKVALYVILIGSAVLAIFLGMLAISVVSYFLLWTGRLLGGKGTFQTIRSAVAWANVPNTVNILMWLILVGHFGSLVFDSTFGQRPFLGTDLYVVMPVFLVQLIVSIWSFVILLKTLGEVQGFSAWRALINVLIPVVIIFIIVWLLGSISS